jgi:hypothetical protein
LREPVTSSNRSFDLTQIASEGIFSLGAWLLVRQQTKEFLSASPLDPKYRASIGVFSQDFDWTRAWLGTE